jgi:sigma-B regulation protein RsbU (phosphoserine phosphatase)
LLLGPEHERSLEVCEHLRSNGFVADYAEFNAAALESIVEAADALVCLLDGQTANVDGERVQSLLALAESGNLPVLLWGATDNLGGANPGLADCLPANVGVDEVVGRLTALLRYAPIVHRLENELQRLQRVGHHLNRYFEEVDHEMRLAGRLQHEFLPRSMPAMGPLRFAQLYRPATWVSGDIFDVFPIDERQLGVLIADAMGHGTAAGLMTMFVRRALVPTQRKDGRETVRPPAEALFQMHEALARQHLPNAQFVTAAYAIIDTETLQMQLARGGHPYPVHARATGEIRELQCEGGLLGIDGLEPEFDGRCDQLAPGDKVLFYTDGLEDLFIAGRSERTMQPEFSATLRDWVHLDAENLVAAVSTHLDQQEGSLNPDDDMTLVVAEVV